MKTVFSMAKQEIAGLLLGKEEGDPVISQKVREETLLKACAPNLGKCGNGGWWRVLLLY